MGLNEDIQNGNTVSQLKDLGYSASDLKNYEGHSYTREDLWEQLGDDIDGENNNEWSGKVSLSDDGTIVAIGGGGYNSNEGRVRVYQRNVDNTTVSPIGWTQLGDDIDGESTSWPYMGVGVSLSGDGTIVACGAPGMDSRRGLVRVYQYNGTDWTQMGSDMTGSASDSEFGWSVALSGDGTRLVVGAPRTPGSSGGTWCGKVAAYQYNGTEWTQMGSDITWNTAGDYHGYSVDMSTDGTTLALGAPCPFTTYKGYVEIYLWSEEYSTWWQKGFLSGESGSGNNGWSVSLSGDKNTIAMGSPEYDSRKGLVKIYTKSDGGNYNNSTFHSTSQNFVGYNYSSDPEDGFGYSVNLNSDGTILAIGAIYNDDGPGTNPGSVKVYKRNSEPNSESYGTWVQWGQDIDGEAADDKSGMHISLSSDGTILAIGSETNDDGGNDAGHVRIYRNRGGLNVYQPFTLSQLAVGFTALELHDGGFTVSELKDVYSLAELKTSGLTVSQLKDVYEVQELHDVGFDAGDMKDAGYTVNELKDDYTLGELKTGGFLLDDVRDHYTDNELIAAGYNLSVESMKASGKTIDEVIATNMYTLSEIRTGTDTTDGQAGYTASEFKAAGFTTTQMKGAGFTATEMKGAGFTATELYGQTFTVEDPSLQLGQDIEGGTAGDLAGHSVSINQDGTIIAVGAHRALNENSEGAAGSIKIYQWNGTDTWIQLGSTIYGDASWDVLGQSVSLSSDGTIVATGAIEQRDNVKGYVKVFQWNGTDTWIQLGSTIYGTSNNDRSGYSVSLSSDGTIVAIGAHRNDAGPGNDSGQVRVFQWNDSAWVQLGNDIYGEADSDNSGVAVSLSSDGTIVAIGATSNKPTTTDTGTGHVRVYQWNGTAWTQIGQDINGVGDYARMGTAVSLNSDGTIIACGAPYGGGNKGIVEIYQWDGTDTWIQLGSTIIGDTGSDEAGKSVSLNSDGSIVAIGYGEGGVGMVGRVRVYQWNGTAWTKLVEDINGQPPAGEIESAFQVSLTKDGSTLVIGGENWSGNKGRAKVYRIRELSGFGASLSELITAGFTATELKGAGFTVNDLENDFTVTELKAAGYNATEMRDAGILLDAVRGIYTDDELIAAGYSLSVESMKASGKTIDEVIATNKYTLSEIRTGSDTTDGQTGYTAAEFKAAAFTTTEMKGAGFTATEMKEAEFTATELKAGGYNATQLKAAVFTATQMKAAGYNATEMKAAVFTATQMKEAGYNATQMKDGQYALSELKGVYEVQELHDTGFTVAEMKTGLYTAGQLTGIYGIQEMHDGGYRVDDMKEAGHGVDDLKDSYEMDEIFEGGFTNASDLFRDGKGYSINEIKTIKKARPLIGKINNESVIENLSNNDFIYIYGRDGVLRAKIPIKSISTGTEGGNAGKKTINLD